MQFTAEQIADLLEGVVDGDPQVLVSDLAKIEEARSGTLTFLANPRYNEFIYSTKATIAIVDTDFQPARPLPNQRVHRRPRPDRIVPTLSSPQLEETRLARDAS